MSKGKQLLLSNFRNISIEDIVKKVMNCLGSLDHTYAPADKTLSSNVPSD